MKNFIFLFVIPFFFHSCSPIKTSSKEEKHQLELTLHEVQTNLDDLRHDISCFHTEMQIIDGKIKHQEDSLQNLKKEYIEKTKNKIEILSKELSFLEKRSSSFEENSTNSKNEVSQLSSHANETTLALSQHKQKINELEDLLIKQERKLNKLSKIKTTLEDIVKTIKSNSSNYFLYKVKAKDSLEKIAKKNNVSISAIKRLNNLENDLIVIGQELKIPK